MNSVLLRQKIAIKFIFKTIAGENVDILFDKNNFLAVSHVTRTISITFCVMTKNARFIRPAKT